MASSTDGFQSALEWSKRNNELLRQKAAAVPPSSSLSSSIGGGGGASAVGANAAHAAVAAGGKVAFDWKKSLPDIALIVVCVTVVMLALIFMVKNLMASKSGEQQTVTSGTSNQSAVDGLMRQNHRPADIAQNAIPILV